LGREWRRRDRSRLEVIDCFTLRSEFGFQLSGKVEMWHGSGVGLRLRLCDFCEDEWLWWVWSGGCGLDWVMRIRSELVKYFFLRRWSVDLLLECNLAVVAANPHIVTD
jgi:hypothetical protein